MPRAKGRAEAQEAVIYLSPCFEHRYRCYANFLNWYINDKVP